MSKIEEYVGTIIRRAEGGLTGRQKATRRMHLINLAEAGAQRLTKNGLRIFRVDENAPSLDWSRRNLRPDLFPVLLMADNEPTDIATKPTTATGFWGVPNNDKDGVRLTVARTLCLLGGEDVPDGRVNVVVKGDGMCINALRQLKRDFPKAPLQEVRTNWKLLRKRS